VGRKKFGFRYEMNKDAGDISSSSYSGDQGMEESKIRLHVR